MQVDINAVKFSADKKLLEFIKLRLAKLEQYHNNIISSEVFLRVENESGISNKVVEIKLNVPGIDLFSKKHAKSFEEGADEAIEALRRQIVKRKEKFK